jgi:iron-sulfur cluster repair protein YtfE (RIC family)
MTEDVTPQLGCKTDDMKMIHAMFRREFRLAGPMIRHVADGDKARAARVAVALKELVTGLHHHHHGEDTLLWDTLVERSPACAIHVGLMKEQHAQVAALLEQVDGLSSAWTADPTPANREALASLLDTISRTLEDHLGQEETHILPVATSSLLQEEWNRLGEEGLAAIPKNRRLIQLGYILEDATPEQRADLLARVPAPARLLYKLVGRRQYEKERDSLRAPA